MNLTVGKIFRKLENGHRFTRFLNKEILQLNYNSGYSQTRNKTGYVKRNIFEADSGLPEYPKRSNATKKYLGLPLLTIPIVTFMLGVWQIKRWAWKVNLIEELKQRTSQPPIDLLECLDKLESKEFYPVRVRGTFLHDKEFVIGPKSLIVNGKPNNESEGKMFSGGKTSIGYYIVTPFKLIDQDLTILVNRGWVPLKYKNSQLRPAGQVKGVVELNGIVRHNEKRSPFIPANRPKDNVWYYRDVEGIAAAGNTAPIFIDATVEGTVPGGPIGGQTNTVLRNEHLSYIITWFSLSGATGYMWFRHFVQKIPTF
ncbi:hypothetical protein KM043_015651 [Ampulex compressa]|nr:hypothetical protein KM043_015651 [Ampulex compressa]